MSTTINNGQPNYPQNINNKKQPGYAGVNINCYTIDPTKLPPDSPLLKGGAFCTVDNGCGPNWCSYPPGYYTNNYGPQSTNNSTNTRKKRITILTDNYIKNLEAYLNAEDNKIREYAAKEIFKRFDEDKTRYDDAALNALVNKMLKDPNSHKVKATALQLLRCQLAQGNQNTVSILQDMARNVNEESTNRQIQDATIAKEILLKMSSPTELIDVPVYNRDNTLTKGIED